MEVTKVLKFPNKRTRNSYKKKLLSLYTTIDILVVTTGLLLYDIIVWAFTVIKTKL